MGSAPSSSLRILPLGIGDAFSSVDYHTALLVMSGKTTCLVDCPDPIQRILRERTSCLGKILGPGDIDHILLTHLHGDHSNGLEAFLFQRHFVLQAPPVSIHSIPEVGERLWEEKLAVSMEKTEMSEVGLEEVFSRETFYSLRIVPQERSFLIGDLCFEIRRTIHSVPTFGFRVGVDGVQGGRPLFGYSCDTIYDPGHIEFLSPADLIFHECSESSIH
ncbi:ribonuclease Z, partial [bacterium]|nr:ribonuclease Z [bacterium]